MTTLTAGQILAALLVAGAGISTGHLGWTLSAVVVACTLLPLEDEA